jgi:PAS domain S-box-containing protein
MLQSALRKSEMGDEKKSTEHTAIGSHKTEYSTMHTPDGKVRDESGVPVLDGEGRLLGTMEIAQDIAERMQVEDVLHKYAFIISATPDLMSFVDRDYCYRAVNEAYLWAHQKTRDQIVGHSVAELNGAEVFDAVIKPEIDRCLAGEQIRYEGWFEYAGLGHRFMDVAYNPYRDRQGAISGVVVSVHDITERKRAEDALKESEERHRQVSGLIGDYAFSCVKHPGGGFVIDWLVGALEDITGYSIDEVKNRGCWKFFVHPSDVPLFESNVIGLGPGEESDCELRIVRKDGLIRWMRVSTRALDDNKRSLSHRIYGSCEDITEGKCTEEALRRSEHKFRSVFNSANEMIVLHELVYDAHGQPNNYRILDCNPTFTRDTGIPANEAVGALASQLYGTGEPPYLDTYANVVLTGKPVQFEVYFASMKKHFSISAVSLGNGLFATVTTDITESKQAEEVLRVNEERLRAALEATQQGWFDLNVQTGEVYVSSEYARIIGHDPAKFKTSLQQWIEGIHPEDRNAVLTAYRECLETSETRIMEYRRQTRTGDWKWIRSIGKIICFDAKGNPLRMTGTHADISKIKQAEAALQESDELHRTLVEASPDSISVADTNGMIMFASRRAREMFGHTPDEDLTGRSLIEWVSPEEHERALGGIDLLLTEGSPISGEYALLRKDGTRFFGEINAATFYSLEGNPKGLLLVTRDITERKRAEESLRESEEKYRGIFDESVAAIYIFDTHKNFVNSNQAGLDLLGYSREELLRMSIPDVDADPVVVLPAHQQLLSGGRLVNYEHKLRRKDGAVLTVLNNSRPLTDLHGNVVGMLSTLIDITERKRTQELLRQSENRYRQLFELIRDGIILAGINGRILAVNQAMCDLCGRSRAWLLEARLGDFETAASRLQMPKRIQTLEAKGQAGFDIEIFHPDGLVRLSEVMTRRVDWFGRPAFLGVVRDITERKRIEEERRQLEERLQRAEKMEALGTLAGGVAHDLNNVLGIITGYSDLLSAQFDESNSARPIAREILKAGVRAAAIVQDLLTLARRGVSSRKVLNLNNIFLECQNSPEFAKVLSEHPDIEFKTDFEVDLLNMSGSSVHLEKSFLNLVSNAAEAMPNGGTLKIKTANCYLDKPILGYDEVREGDYVVLSLSDTGEGIPASSLKRIFEPFYTKKAMRRGSGTGLGLAVVWGTVKDHLGYINVESEEDKGTTFTLYFPVTREELTPEQVSISVAEYKGNGESILVVDDVKEQRELASMMLRNLNYAVESVSSGEKAAKYLKQHQVDLIVLDMIMDPGIDGLDTYRKILEIHPQQKAIIVSGFSETERVAQTQALGAGAYVKKPYVLEKLGLAVRKELDHSV